MGHTWPFQFGFPRSWEQRHLMEMAGTVLLYLCMFPSGHTWRFELTEIIFMFRTWDTHGRFNSGFPGHGNSGISWRWRVLFSCTYACFQADIHGGLNRQKSFSFSEHGTHMAVSIVVMRTTGSHGDGGYGFFVLMHVSRENAS